MTFERPLFGSLERGEQIARRADASVPAYASFLRERGWASGTFQTRPITDKNTYIHPYPFAQLVGDDYNETFSIVASSGSSGNALYWPQLREGHAERGASFRRFLETGFSIHDRPTIAVVGLALGSWIGGDMISWSLKDLSATVPYPFAVFVPGSRHGEILRFLRDASPMLGERGQFLLFVCPSAIGHLGLLAQTSGAALPHNRLRFAVLGEPFPEDMRISLRAAACVDPRQSPILSIYGSADTGVLGAESSASSLVRTILHTHPALSEQLGLSRTPPHLFHAAAPDALLETVAGELCVTRWQGIPLIRYNLHDRARLLDWPLLRTSLIESPQIDSSFRAALVATPSDLPGVIAIQGRADRCLILCGTNISESMLDSAVASCGMDDALTGVYRASIVFDSGTQRLALELEMRSGVRSDAVLTNRAYQALVRALGRVQPEFADDWSNVYRRWDEDESHRILRLTFTPWPALSERSDGSIKNRGVVA